MRELQSALFLLNLGLNSQLKLPFQNYGINVPREALPEEDVLVGFRIGLGRHVDVINIINDINSST